MAASPDTVKQFTGAGCDVLVERGAGQAARFADADYEDAGATIVDDRDEAVARADVVAAVHATGDDGWAPASSPLREGCVLVGFFAAHRNLEVVRRLAEQRVTALAFELVPRITRAQSLDALSSQASLAGYRAVIAAAARLDKHFPLAMTAAGTLRPAKVVIIGAGVAGLQALATARRLGAIVEVSDIRPAAKEEVESLGGVFIDPPEPDEDTATDGVYARSMGDDFLTRQRRQLAERVADADALITTALIPGRPAPTIVTEDIVAAMRPGSVVIDLAAAEGGNCELTPPTGELEVGGVTIVAAPDLAATMPHEASVFYARNVLEMTRLVLSDGEVTVDLDDDIIGATTLTHAGAVVHERTAEQLAATAPSPPGAPTGDGAGAEGPDRVIVLDEPAPVAGGSGAQRPARHPHGSEGDR